MNFWMAFISGIAVGYFVGWAVLSVFILLSKQQATEIEELEKTWRR